MTQKENFDSEKENFDRIYLYRKDIFWKAYEKSAFRFVKFVRPYRIKKKFIKNVGSDMTIRRARVIFPSFFYPSL